MGMFDDVHVAQIIQCPKCEKPLGHTWQSKSGPCHMLTLVPAQVSQFYKSCDACGEWVQFDRRYDPKDIVEDFEMSHSPGGGSLPSRR